MKCVHFLHSTTRTGFRHSSHCVHVVCAHLSPNCLLCTDYLCCCMHIAHCKTPDAVCWLAWSLKAMVTGNRGAVNVLKRGKLPAFSPSVNLCLRDHRDWWKPPTCRGWTTPAPRDAQMRHQVTSDEGPAWCKSGKTWTQPEVKPTKWKIWLYSLAVHGEFTHHRGLQAAAAFIGFVATSPKEGKNKWSWENNGWPDFVWSD